VPLTGAQSRGLSLRGVLLPALLAAIAGGVVTTVLQQIFLVPLILQAESLEVAGDLHAVAEAGLQRAAYTLVFNCLGAFGFALLLALARRAAAASWRQGCWGLPASPASPPWRWASARCRECRRRSVCAADGDSDCHDDRSRVGVRGVLQVTAAEAVRRGG
jgi:hypothetical protein